MHDLANTIMQDYSGLTFSEGDAFHWSPETQVISVEKDKFDQNSGIWSLLHEIGHSLLKHRIYRDDLELMMMEVEAWMKAREIAKKYNIDIDEKHIEACLEGYRQWLHERSRCIECQSHCFQLNRTTYKCHNCQIKWKVPTSVICQIRKRRI